MSRSLAQRRCESVVSGTCTQLCFGFLHAFAIREAKTT